MRLKTCSVLMVAGLALPSLAHAEVRNFTVAKDASGIWKCTEAIDANPAAQPNDLVVNVEVKGAAVGSWSLTIAGTTPQTLTAFAGRTDLVTVTVPKATVGSATLALNGKVENADVTCDMKAAPSGASRITNLDPEAQAWLLDDEGQEELQKLRARFSNTRLLVHLPSGHPAAPAPASLSERDDYQLVLVIDRQLAAKEAWRADVDVTTCSARDPFRIKGNFSSAEGAKQVRAHQWMLLPVERPLTCGADKMTYAMTVSLGETKVDAVSTTWTIRPVYHLAATFAPGFDLSKPKSYSVVNGKIAENQNTVGLILDIGFLWFPWGVDYQDMRWYNHWVNPFLLFKANAITDGFKLGTAITPTGGISLGVGVAVNKSAVLKGVSVGDALATGDPPTNSVWNKDGVGWYFGILIDDNIFKALKGVVGTASK